MPCTLVCVQLASKSFDSRLACRQLRLTGERRMVMTALARSIDERLKELDWQRKRLAHEWLERVGNGSHATYETRLSKLLNDDQDGYDFLLGERSASLADALGWSAEHLSALVERSLKAPTLLLDPGVPDDFKTFVGSRHQLDYDAFNFVLVDCGPVAKGVREHVRDQAKKYRKPIVVLADGKDADFFQGAGLITSRFERASPGYVLVACPDLFPKLPAKLFDDDGTPMVPDEGKESYYRERLVESQQSQQQRWNSRPIGESEKLWLDVIAQADAEARPVSFRVDWLCGGRPPDNDRLKRLLLESAVRKIRPEKFAREEQAKVSHVWLRDRQILALAPPDDETLLRFEAHHPVHRVATFDPVVDALAKAMAAMNPHAQGGALDLNGELHGFEEETGIALAVEIAEVRAQLASLESKCTFSEGLSLRTSVESDNEVRRFMDDVLAREFVLPEEHASKVFVLQAIRSAPLIHVSSKDRVLRTIANLGAGRLIQLDVTRFAGEKPSAVRMVAGSIGHKKAGTFDGGDVRFSLTELFDGNLEGSVLQSVGRRRAEEAARADDYDD